MKTAKGPGCLALRHHWGLAGAGTPSGFVGYRRLPPNTRTRRETARPLPESRTRNPRSPEERPEPAPRLAPSPAPRRRATPRRTRYVLPGQRLPKPSRAASPPPIATLAPKHEPMETLGGMGLSQSLPSRLWNPTPPTPDQSG